MRESNADRYQFHLPATTRDGLKPRRGGLFIATNTHSLFFLFFGGAARASISTRGTWMGADILDGIVVANAAPPKNKKKGTIYVLPYKQATPQQPVKGAVARGCKSHPSNWAVRDGTARCLSMPQGWRGKQSWHRTDGPK